MSRAAVARTEELHKVELHRGLYPSNRKGRAAERQRGPERAPRVSYNDSRCCEHSAVRTRAVVTPCEDDDGASPSGQHQVGGCGPGASSPKSSGEICSRNFRKRSTSSSSSSGTA